MGNQESVNDSNIIVYRFSPNNVFVYDPLIQTKPSPQQYFDVCEARMRGFDPKFICKFTIITNPDDHNLAISLYELWKKSADREKIIQSAKPLFQNVVVEACRKFGIPCLYHITGIQNLYGILTQGLLCSNKAETKHDISDPEIQGHRHFKQIPIYPHMTVHDCVPLFFAPKPPMLSSRREQQAEIVYLCIDPMVLSLPEVTFSDGNARSNATRFYKDLEYLGSLDWGVLKAKYWNHDDPEIHSENKRRRSAEVLVPDQIPITFIQKIIVMNQNALIYVSSLVKEVGQNIPVQINRELYFGVSGNYEVSFTQSFSHTIDLLETNAAPEPPPNFELDDPLCDDY